MLRHLGTLLRREREGTENSRFQPNESSVPEIDMTRLPKHIAIIMDANGRWAEQRGLPRYAGHQAGVDSLRRVVRLCSDLGVRVLTVYAFSTENWERPRQEVDFLMTLLARTLELYLDELTENGVRVNVIGRLEGLPPALRAEVDRALARTRCNTGLVLNVAWNYGGRAEIVDAARRLAVAVANGELAPDQIDEANFAARLYTSGLPDPDLLIRTGGDMRISNFLLWQLAYSELWVTPVRWPDFDREHLLAAIRDYQSRHRRFGRV